MIFLFGLKTIVLKNKTPENTKLRGFMFDNSLFREQ
jgi:hypothetical protein